MRVKRAIWKGYGLTGIILVLTSPILLADSDSRRKEFDQDQGGRRSDHEKGRHSGDSDHRGKNNWMDDHRDEHDRRDKHRHPKRERTHFDDDDRRYLHGYYRHYDQQYWASHNPPPALFKHLKHHKPLPPGFRTYLVPFPVDVEQYLCPVLRNYVRFMIGGRGMILDAQFNIEDVFDLH
jgi:hypothetical protein